MWTSLLTLVACGGRHAPPEPPEDPAALAAAARARVLPPVLKVGFSLGVDAPRLGVSGTAKGGLIAARPDRLRLDLLTPFGTSLGTAASDGQTLAVYLSTKNTLYEAANAETLLRELTGGAAGFADLCTLLVGGLPFEGAEVLDLYQDRGQTTWTFAGPEGSRASLTLDDRRQVTTAVRAWDSAGREVLTADYTDYNKLDGTWLPDEVELTLPLQDIRLDLGFGRWEALPEAPPVFTLPAPRGAERVDLSAWLKEMRAGSGGGE